MANKLSNFFVYAIALALICFFVADVSSVSLEKRIRDKRMSELFGKRDGLNEQKRYYAAFRQAPSAIVMDPYDNAVSSGDHYRNVWAKRMSEMFGKRQGDGSIFPQWYGK